jgi:hypothetical protein
MKALREQAIHAVDRLQLGVRADLEHLIMIDRGLVCHRALTLSSPAKRVGPYTLSAGRRRIAIRRVRSIAVYQRLLEPVGEVGRWRSDYG